MITKLWQTFNLVLITRLNKMKKQDFCQNLVFQKILLLSLETKNEKEEFFCMCILYLEFLNK